MPTDGHVHLSQSGHDGQSYAAIRDSPVRSMSDHGIRYSFVCPDGEPGTCVAGLDAVKALTDPDQGLLMYGTTSLPLAPAGVHDRLEHLAARGAIVGLKLYPGFELCRPSDTACHPFYELCLRHDLPVLSLASDAEGERMRGQCVAFVRQPTRRRTRRTWP